MGNRNRILIVDDERSSVKFLAAMLPSEQCETIKAYSGEDALKMVADRPPDLILLDVLMPGIDGFEVCRRLKQDEKTKMIPIVMVTTLKGREHRVRGMEAGADDFLSKPVDKTELRVRIKSLLRIKAYHDELLKSCNEISESNKKLQELERIKEGLIHMIIHDLKNPLTAISWNIKLILMESQGLSEPVVEAMERSRRCCRELNWQIQGLLDIRRMEEGRLRPDKQATNLGELTDDVLEQFKPKAQLDHISLSFQGNGDLPTIRLDRSLMKRVIANLLDNAIRHSPKGGTIDVAADFLPKRERIRLSVKDKGTGLPPEYHQKVFDKFEQVELKETAVQAGSCGLGLAYCKMAVEAHGGKIWVESEGKGKGCTFTFEIPA